MFRSQHRAQKSMVKNPTNSTMVAKRSANVGIATCAMSHRSNCDASDVQITTSMEKRSSQILAQRKTISRCSDSNIVPEVMVKNPTNTIMVVKRSSQILVQRKIIFPMFESEHR